MLYGTGRGLLLVGAVLRVAAIVKVAMKESLILAQLAALLVRLLVGQFSHSGQGRPPMYGDYEAQRHWMELTRALPVGDWYRHCADNDLLYWGLDYPPLTAYVSWLFGLLAEGVVPDLVTLHTSRGYEGVSGKLFMRATVLLSDVIVYFPSVVLMATLFDEGASDSKKRKSKKQDGAPVITVVSFRLLSVLLVPSLLLIDHGHFQYNSVSVGLAVLGAYCITTNRTSSKRLLLPVAKLQADVPLLLTGFFRRAREEDLQ